MPIPVSALERLKKNSVGKIIYIRKVIRDKDGCILHEHLDELVGKIQDIQSNGTVLCYNKLSKQTHIIPFEEYREGTKSRFYIIMKKYR